jgi:hypothetical protein
MNRERVDIRHKILELCAEDDYGSWELWWAVTDNAASSAEDLQQEFIAIVEELVNERALLVKTRAADHNFLAAPFSRARLQTELKRASRPDPDSFYWFGAPEP